MHWTLYDLPPELEGDERGPDADAPAEFDPPAELEAAPDFPTLTDSPPAAYATRRAAGVSIKGVTMFYSADEMYDDEITSGPYDREEINFEAAAAELCAPLLPESANFYEDADDAEQDDDAHLPDPLDELEDEQ